MPSRPPDEVAAGENQRDEYDEAEQDQPDITVVGKRDAAHQKAAVAKPVTPTTRIANAISWRVM
jgi:hypothetical protein